MGYVVWLYNSEFNSLGSGDYDLDLKEVFERLSDRMVKI